MNNLLLRGQNMYSMAHQLGLTYFLALRQFWVLSFMVVSVFASSISLVYVKAMDRMLYSNLQSLQKQRDNDSIEWGQLLLEQSTWSTQARIESIAETKLDMQMSEQNKVIMVRE